MKEARSAWNSRSRLCGLAAAALVAVAPASMQAQSAFGAGALQGAGAGGPFDRFDLHDANGARSVEGTWAVTVTPPFPGAPSHKAYISFVPGGVVVAGPDPFLPPSVAPIVRMATAQGTWESTRPKEFAWTFIALGFDVSGSPVGFLKFSGRARLTGKDSFEGAAKVARCELDLTTCGPYTSAAAANLGTRLPLETITLR